MSKNKNNKNVAQPKGRKNKGRKARKLPGMGKPSVDVRALAHKVCAITDPFCPASSGARWPDGSAFKSVTYRAESLQIMSTNASGNIAHMYSPTWTGTGSQLLRTTTDEAGYIFDFNGASAADVTCFTLPDEAYVKQIRTVSFGIRFVPSCTPMTASGNVIALSLSPISGTYDATVPFGYPRYFSSWGICPVRKDDNLAAIGCCMGPEGRMFNPGTASITNVATGNTFDWTPLGIAVIGGPASTIVGHVQAVWNFEIIYSTDSSLISMAKAPTTKSNLLMDASSYVSNRLSSVMQGSAAKLEQTLLQRAEHAVVSTVGGVVGGLLGGPTGAQAGRIALPNMLLSDHPIAVD